MARHQEKDLGNKCMQFWEKVIAEDKIKSSARWSGHQPHLDETFTWTESLQHQLYELLHREHRPATTKYD